MTSGATVSIYTAAYNRVGRRQRHERHRNHQRQRRHRRRRTNVHDETDPARQIAVAPLSSVVVDHDRHRRPRPRRWLAGAGVSEREARLAYTYNESITFGNGSANVVQTAGNYWLDGWSSSASGSTGTIAFPWVPNGVLPTGRYLATLGADRFQDYAGNSSAASSFAFWFLAADINRDQVVNFGDLLILAQNYGAIGRTFGQGNVDYSTDGSVNFGDLLLLAQRYGSTLPVAADAVAADAAADKSPTRKRVIDELLADPDARVA